MSPTLDQDSKEAGDSLPKKIEAVLFAAGRKVSLQELCDLCSVKEGGLVKEAIKELRSELDARGSSILLIEEADGWKFTVREAYLSLVQSIVPHMELDHALLETLAVIAWKQPVLQAEVVRIRTTAAYEHVKILEEMGFVSKEKHGNTFLLKATGKFFDYFDLPNKEAVREMFKHIEARHEKELKEQAQEGQATLNAEFDAGTKGKHEHLGSLDVYDAALEEKPAGRYDQQRLGRLEVVDEEPPLGGGGEADSREGGDEGQESVQVPEDEEGKMKRVVEELTGEKIHDQDSAGNTPIPERRKLHAVLEDMASQPLESVDEEDGKVKKPSLFPGLLPRAPVSQKEHNDDEEDDEEDDIKKDHDKDTEAS